MYRTFFFVREGLIFECSFSKEGIFLDRSEIDILNISV